MDLGASPGGEGADAWLMRLRRLFLPQDDCVLTADVSAENRGWLGSHLALPVRLLPRQDLVDRITRWHGADLREQAVFGLARRFPELSAQTVVTPGQAVILSLIGAALLAGFLDAPLAAIHLAVAVLAGMFTVSSLFRVVLALLARKQPDIAPAQVALPTYTILVPMYGEAEVLPGLVRGLTALDYPADLLDIKLVLEADDGPTVAAARALAATPGLVPFEIIAVPPCEPRTKPKAANYALAFARGEYLVVYDAEDRPEPDQLRKAVATFRASSRVTACLQARLNFYNAGHNWLTRGIMAQTPLELNPA